MGNMIGSTMSAQKRIMLTCCCCGVVVVVVVCGVVWCGVVWCGVVWLDGNSVNAHSSIQALTSET
jgi:hypothetical protein